MYSFVVFGSISEDLLGSISLFDNIADSDLSKHIHIFQELEPFLLTVKPPWIEQQQRTHLYFPERLLSLKESKKESKAKKADWIYHCWTLRSCLQFSVFLRLI